MSDIKLVQDILSQIDCAANRVRRRFSSIESVNTFLNSEEGVGLLCFADQITTVRRSQIIPLYDSWLISALSRYICSRSGRARIPE
jgi:hypothetical protein